MNKIKTSHFLGIRLNTQSSWASHKTTNQHQRKHRTIKTHSITNSSQLCITG